MGNSEILRKSTVIVSLSVVIAFMLVSGCTTKPQIVNFSERALTLPNPQNPEIVFIVPPKMIDHTAYVSLLGITPKREAMRRIGDMGVPIRNAFIERFKDYNIKILDTDTDENIHAPAVVKIWMDSVEMENKVRHFPWPAATPYATYNVTATDLNNNWSEKLKAEAWSSSWGYPEERVWSAYKNASEVLVKDIYKLLIKKGTIRKK